MKQRFIFVLILCLLFAQGSYSQTCGNNVTEVGQTCDDGDITAQDGCDQNCQLECGNGQREPLEECDDGNRINFDGCDSNCQLQCGNGITEGNEQCDDGNTVATDACDNFCNLNCGNFQITGTETCDDGNRISGDGCDSNCQIQGCGNSRRDFGEGCDDGNTASGDGCSSTCQIQDGWICPTVGTCVLGVCGDSTVAGIEQCDDGNTISGDGCSSTCQNEVCGNGILDSARNQTCDDGNTVAGDGCAANCTVQANFTCPNPGQPCIAIVTCGNSRVEAGEQCDDGNTINGDGCTSSCTLQVCGNGVIEGPEECDDGNTAPGDGCSSFCDIEAICGNGVLEEGEECDDGNTVSNDKCSSICELEGEVVCTNGVCNPITAFCGNGIQEFQFGEACDDGNKNSGDGCSSTCQVEGNFICRNQFFPSICTQCGNAVGDAGQACDDGNFASGDGCSSSCVVENGWNCSASFPSICTLIPIPIVCGNGIVQTGQACDDGNTANGDGCDSACMIQVPVNNLAQQQCLQNPNATFNGTNCSCRPTFTQVGTACVCLPTQFLNNSGLCERIPPPCGNGIRQPQLQQECDDGNNAPGDGCNANCFIEAGWTCFLQRNRSICQRVDTIPAPTPTPTPDPVVPVNLCGNGFLQSANGEQCDDGNLVAFDGCSPNCNVETNFNCTSVENQTSVCTPITCGNGNTQPQFQEQCDDGNRVDGDGCSSTCQTEAGSFCVGTACFSLCGNGVIDRSTNEQCDDANTNPNDGCSPSCQIEPGFSCVVSFQGFSICRPSCGNGVREGVQQCDDFNVASGDGCSPSCVIEPGWTCTQTPAGLSICNSTTVAFCGNAVFEPANNEQCDDGNNVNTDGCSNGCILDPNFVCTNVPGQQTQCGPPQPALTCLDPSIQLGNRRFPPPIIAALAGTSIQATTYGGFVQELVTINNGVGTIDFVKARQAQVALIRANRRNFWAGLWVIVTRCAGQ